MLKDITVLEQKMDVADINSSANSGVNYGAACRAGSLAGKFIVASPSLQESCFTRSVIYMCVHNESGAMGVIVNYPIENVGVDDILEQLNMENAAARSLPVHFGGPVESNRGFIIHSDEFTENGVIFQKDGVAVTSNADVLLAMSKGGGPKQSLLALGYAGWTAGQLESEMESGSWIVVSATKQLLFETNNEMKWSLSIASLGFDVGHFSNSVGHA
jgi:putative transcriptional regulator